MGNEREEEERTELGREVRKEKGGVRERGIERKERRT